MLAQDEGDAAGGPPSSGGGGPGESEGVVEASRRPVIIRSVSRTSRVSRDAERERAAMKAVGLWRGPMDVGGHREAHGMGAPSWRPRGADPEGQRFMSEEHHAMYAVQAALVALAGTLTVAMVVTMFLS